VIQEDENLAGVEYGFCECQAFATFQFDQAVLPQLDGYSVA
jgi:hypothetical protein